MKLTKELLWKLGFRSEGKSITKNPLYRLEIPWGNKHFKNPYYFEFQIELNSYKGNNPNNGILSLYERERKDQHASTWVYKEEKNFKSKVKKRIDFVEWEDEEIVCGIKYITLKERIIPIAHNVTTLERLNAIYVSITGNEPLKELHK